MRLPPMLQRLHVSPACSALAGVKEFADLRAWAGSFAAHFLRDSSANPFLVVEALFWRADKSANAEVARHYGLIDGTAVGLDGSGDLAAILAGGACARPYEDSGSCSGVAYGPTSFTQTSAPVNPSHDCAQARPPPSARARRRWSATRHSSRRDATRCGWTARTRRRRCVPRRAVAALEQITITHALQHGLISDTIALSNLPNNTRRPTLT